MKICLKNPCKKCVVRPMCNKECEKMKSYYTLFYACMVISPSIIIFILVVCIAVILYLSPYPKIGLGGLSGLILVVYLVAIIFINDEIIGNDNKWYEIVIAYVFGIWCLPGILICSKYENYVDLYIYRFNYKIDIATYNLAKEKGKVC